MYRNLGAHTNRPTYRCRDRAVRVDVLVQCSVNAKRHMPFVRQVEIARSCTERRNIEPVARNRTTMPEYDQRACRRAYGSFAM